MVPRKQNGTIGARNVRTIGCIDGEVYNACTTPPIPKAELAEIQNSIVKEAKRWPERRLRFRSNNVVCFSEKKQKKKRSFQQEMLPLTGVVQAL